MPSASLHKPISDDNKGAQMLLNMGWRKGEGLGRHGSGILDPVKAESYGNNAGIGATAKYTVNPDASYKERTVGVVSELCELYWISLTLLKGASKIQIGVLNQINLIFYRPFLHTCKCWQINFFSVYILMTKTATFEIDSRPSRESDQFSLQEEDPLSSHNEALLNTHQKDERSLIKSTSVYKNISVNLFWILAWYTVRQKRTSYSF